MAWTTPPSFSVGSTLQAAPLNAIAACLTALDSTPQINSITTVPLVGNAPPIDEPNFLLDLNVQSQDTNSQGQVTFNFGAPFPNGVLFVLAFPGEAAVPGLVVNPKFTGMTTSRFICQCWYESASNMVIYTNAVVTVQWVAVGF